jgi:hypothetical protein
VDSGECNRGAILQDQLEPNVAPLAPGFRFAPPRATNRPPRGGLKPGNFAASVRDSGNIGGLDSFGRNSIEGGFEDAATAQPAVP